MKKMHPISCDDARDEHGITCAHSRLENGELRFRLLKNDRTAYIRTEAPPDGAWQDSHWHSKIRETYIVQQGWMGYAEMRAGRPYLFVYNAGESFTTPPDVIHNVYLPSGAVIHTVKHGDADGEYRLEDSRTEIFTTKVRKISETDLIRRARTTTERAASENGGHQYAREYSAAYMHFDNLIWQVPAWSSAIFAVVLAGSAAISDKYSKILDEINIEFSIKTFLSSFFGLFAIFLLVLSYSLYRFRCNQARVKDYKPNKPLLSPQVGLQFIVNTQASLLVFLALLLANVGVLYAACIGTFILVILTVGMEYLLGRQGSGGNGPIETRS